MFFLIWASLLFSVRGVSAVERLYCEHGFCIILTEGEITAEAGLCVVIPCSLDNRFRPENVPRNKIWYKCEPSKQRCDDSDIIIHSDMNNKVKPGFKGRVSLLEPEEPNSCSIIINDLTESDSGSYQLGVSDFSKLIFNGFTFSTRTNVSVKVLTQKPTVTVPPLTGGQQTTLTCTAPGLCSGSAPEITWTWRGAGETDRHITGNLTTFKTETLTAVAQRHSSTLMFNTSAEHHGTNVTCKVGFTNGINTEETVTLNVTSDRGASAVLRWIIVAVVSLIVNAVCMILLMLLWSTRKKVKPNQVDRLYMSLDEINSPVYDVIAPQPN